MSFSSTQRYQPFEERKEGGRGSEPPNTRTTSTSRSIHTERVEIHPTNRLDSSLIESASDASSSSSSIQINDSPSPYPPLSPTSSNYHDTTCDCCGCCSCCRSICRWCPCSHIEEQLGLKPLDPDDGLRVYTRLVSLLGWASSFFYFLLLLAFVNFFDYPGAIALLALTFVVHFIVASIGWLASRAKRRHPSEMSSTTSASSTTSSSLIPPHPYALSLLKWSALLPLSLLCFFMAVFLAAAMFGWMEFDTQTTSVLFLGLNSLFSLTLQGASFLLASAWQRAEHDELDPDHGSKVWLDEQSEHSRRELREVERQGTRIDRDEEMN